MESVLGMLVAQEYVRCSIINGISSPAAANDTPEVDTVP